MVWFGKSKRKKRYLALFQLVAKLLMPEATMLRTMGKLAFRDEVGVINGPALGYVYGFADAALQAAKLQLDNELGRDLITQLFELFTPGRGVSHFEYIVNHTRFPDVAMAMQDGGDTYVRWASSKGRLMPWGLGKYFEMGGKAK